MSTKQFLNQTLHSKVQAGEVVLVVVVGGVVLGRRWPVALRPLGLADPSEGSCYICVEGKKLLL